MPLKLLFRVVFLSLGFASVVWCVDRLGSGLTETPLKSVAAGIASGETYSADVLNILAPPSSDSDCRYLCDPETLRSLAIIRVRQAEMVWKDGTVEEGKSAETRAEDVVRRALALSPSDSFLWFALAWLSKNRDGYGPAVAQYLKFSYATGSNEGWIAVHRNGFVVGLMAVLPQDLRDKAIGEFRGLTESDYTADVASILTGPGWAQRGDLLKTVAVSPEQDRVRLARRLLDLGFDLPVPGIERSPARPWH